MFGMFRSLRLRMGSPNFLRMLQQSTIVKLSDLSAGDVLLDIGAGPMSNAIALKRLGKAWVIAIDLSFKNRDKWRAQIYGVQAVVADGCTLPLRSSSVNRILLSSLLQMVPEPSDLLKECLRVLKPNGHVVLSVPNHYQFIPKLLRSIIGSVVAKSLGLPHTHQRLVRRLNRLFRVEGPRGYYSTDELMELLRSSGFRITHHRYAPGRLGSLLWELAVLAYVRFGNIAFHLVFFCYPLARLFDVIIKPTAGSEHIVRIVPADEF